MQNTRTHHTRRFETGNYGVLVADDNAELRKLLDLALRRQGFTVLLACDGAEAIEIFTSHWRAIDVVLLDICMPNLDGLATLAKLRTMTPKRPCCLMSGDLGDHTEESVRESGAQRFFLKPFRIDELCDALRELALGLSTREATID